MNEGASKRIGKRLNRCLNKVRKHTHKKMMHISLRDCILCFLPLEVSELSRRSQLKAKADSDLKEAQAKVDKEAKGGDKDMGESKGRGRGKGKGKGKRKKPEADATPAVTPEVEDEVTLEGKDGKKSSKADSAALPSSTTKTQKLPKWKKSILPPLPPPEEAPPEEVSPEEELTPASPPEVTAKGSKDKKPVSKAASKELPSSTDKTKKRKKAAIKPPEEEEKPASPSEVTPKGSKDKKFVSEAESKAPLSSADKTKKRKTQKAAIKPPEEEWRPDAEKLDARRAKRMRRNWDLIPLDEVLAANYLDCFRDGFRAFKDGDMNPDDLEDYRVVPYKRGEIGLKAKFGAKKEVMHISNICYMPGAISAIRRAVPYICFYILLIGQAVQSQDPCSGSELSDLKSLDIGGYMVYICILAS